MGFGNSAEAFSFSASISATRLSENEVSKLVAEELAEYFVLTLWSEEVLRDDFLSGSVILKLKFDGVRVISFLCGVEKLSSGEFCSEMKGCLGLSSAESSELYCIYRLGMT